MIIRHLGKRELTGGSAIFIHPEMDRMVVVPYCEKEKEKILATEGLETLRHRLLRLLISGLVVRFGSLLLRLPHLRTVATLRHLLFPSLALALALVAVLALSINISLHLGVRLGSVSVLHLTFLDHVFGDWWKRNVLRPVNQSDSNFGELLSQ